VQQDAAGQPLHLIGTKWDITESKRVVKALRKSEERFRTIADYT